MGSEMWCGLRRAIVDLSANAAAEATRPLADLLNERSSSVFALEPIFCVALFIMRSIQHLFTSSAKWSDAALAKKWRIILADTEIEHG